MSKSARLGKGLSALIPEEMLDELKDEKTADKIKMVNIEEIIRRENQPRKTFDEESLKELKESIEEHGLIQPIIVRKTSEGYEIIAGERRYRACKMANLSEIPVIVKDVEGRKIEELSLIENIQKEDLNPIEEALAYNYLRDNYMLTHEELSKIAGKSRSYISNLLRLLDLEDYIKNELISGNLTSAQGRTLLSIKESDKRKKYFEKLLNKEINIRDLEETAKGRRFKNRSEKTGLDVFQSEIVEKLEEKLGTKVRLNFKGKGGKIEVDFYNDEDLERILNLIEGE